MAEDDFLPRLLDGRYRLEASIGHGGMGVVYRGVDETMKRPIAVKLVRAVGGVDLDEEVAGRFLREAKNTARLQHEHIIEVFDLGRTEEGSLYFVMELLQGESLSACLRRDGALSPERTVHIGGQICEALAVAHQAGIVHRDLKPANVMLLHRAGDADFVKVLDFGVAKSYAPDQETQLTHTGMLVGTVDYMAPERILGKPVDGRTDMYALGVVLYRMLSGRPPFRDNGVPGLIHAHLNTMPQPLIEVAPGVPNALDRVVLRCLAKNPDRRYESMTELARALRGAVQTDAFSLVDLEYGVDDDDMATELVRPPADASDDVTLADRPTDDATVRFDRASGREASTLDDSTATLPRPDVAARGSGRQMRVCAMCQTANPLHVRHCTACGVSLAAEEQDAVRARVLPSSRAPSATPPTIPFTPRGGPPSPSRPRRPEGTLDAETPPSPWPSPRPAEAPPSTRTVWQRFLSWTGLRGR